jgi:branched-chain amino acid transport system permease protein
MMKRALPAFWLVVLLTVPLWLQDQYALHILITTGIFIIAAMSLNLLLGYTGQLSLGHVAFFGIGAYASALTSLGFDVELLGGFRVVHQSWPAVAGLFVGVVIAGISGYVIGRLSFQVRGAYFVIVTISFAEVTRLVAVNWVELTQGPLALTNIPPFTFEFPGLGSYTLWSKTAYYYLVVAVGVVAYIVIGRLVGSRIGRAMIALKENESLASSVGIDVTRYLVLAAVVSAAIAGSAGSLYAHYLKIIDPDIFLFIYTVTMVIMVITGGKGTLAGPIVGGIIFGFLPVIVRSYVAPAVQWILYGGLMILIVFLLPQGIVPATERWIAAWMHGRRKPPGVGWADGSEPREQE